MTNEEKALVVQDENVQLGSLQIAGPAQIIQRGTEVAKALADIVNKQHLFSDISGKKYVRVEGWSTLGAMLGVLPREVGVIETEKGDFEATVELVRTNDGMVIGRGSALVSSDEKNWADRPRFARRSMAITRATGKAYRLGFAWIMTLAGYEGTPAEEMIEDAEFREVKTKTNGRTIKQEAIAAIVPLYAENDFEAKGMLKHSNLPNNPSKEQVIEWAKVYRAARDSGLTVEAAAEKANS